VVPSAVGLGKGAGWPASFVKSQGFPRWKSGKGHTLTSLPDPHRQRHHSKQFQKLSASV